MVDEYPGRRLVFLLQVMVQIPLWSMNTRGKDCASALYWCSDSSMVDEYDTGLLVIAVALAFRFLYGRWIPEVCHESVMLCSWFRFLYGRWIPFILPRQGGVIKSSDSSMVDEYSVVSSSVVSSIVSSDSSMVDEYFFAQKNLLILAGFRFLYGRWILALQYDGKRF